MDPSMYSTRAQGLTLAQLMDCLEEDDDLPESNIYILPPDDGNETEVNSDESEDGHAANINHLPRGM